MFFLVDLRTDKDRRLPAGGVASRGPKLPKMRTNLASKNPAPSRGPALYSKGILHSVSVSWAGQVRL